MQNVSRMLCSFCVTSVFIPNSRRRKLVGIRPAAADFCLQYKLVKNFDLHYAGELATLPEINGQRHK